MKNQILLFGNTRNSADIRYFCGMPIHDDYFFFTKKGRKYALLSPLEIGRARRASVLDEIFDFNEVCAAMPGKHQKSYFDAAVYLLRKARIRSFAVPKDFPAAMLENFLKEGFDIEICQSQIFPERERKSAFEQAEIAKANDVASACFCLAEEILRTSEIRGDRLIYQGEILTSEFLRTEIEKLSISLGADALDTIAASGIQACDPHEAGSGPVRPNSLIVFDIFPRLRSSGYFGDMTRTFLKGTPNEKQIRLVESVLRAQSRALDMIAEGVDGAEVHSAVVDSFEADGFKTKFSRGHWGGFFHSTGHGLGLEVHEGPSLGTRRCILESGNVVTVEPGLYYREVGGCRIEDNVLVEQGGVRMLSKYHYNWVIE